jgi:hypothetical protein
MKRLICITSLVKPFHASSNVKRFVPGLPKMGIGGRDPEQSAPYHQKYQKKESKLPVKTRGRNYHRRDASAHFLAASACNGSKVLSLFPSLTAGKDSPRSLSRSWIR